MLPAKNAEPRVPVSPPRKVRKIAFKTPDVHVEYGIPPVPPTVAAQVASPIPMLAEPCTPEDVERLEGVTLESLDTVSRGAEHTVTDERIAYLEQRNANLEIAVVQKDKLIYYLLEIAQQSGYALLEQMVNCNDPNEQSQYHGDTGAPVPRVVTMRIKRTFPGAEARRTFSHSGPSIGHPRAT